MDNSPFFTIGIPVYNCEKYISRCIDSILQQSFTNFEIILVNDGSTDNSLEIINKYIDSDNRITVISQENSGPSTARNTSLKNAKGRYIYFLDGDDVLLDNTLQIAYDTIETKNYPDILQAGFIKDTNGKTEEVYCNFAIEKYKKICKTKDEFAVSIWLHGPLISHLGTRFVKTDFLISNKILFPANFYAGEDRLFTFEIFRKADTMSFVKFCANKHFMNISNSIVTTSSFRTVRDIFLSWMQIYNDLPNWDMSNDFYQETMEEKQKYLKKIREDLLYISGSNRSKQEINSIIDLYLNSQGDEIKKLPIKDKTYVNSIFYILMKLIGIRPTIKIISLLIKLKNK